MEQEEERVLSARSSHPEKKLSRGARGPNDDARRPAAPDDASAAPDAASARARSLERTHLNQVYSKGSLAYLALSAGILSRRSHVVLELAGGPDAPPASHFSTTIVKFLGSRISCAAPPLPPIDDQ